MSSASVKRSLTDYYEGDYVLRCGGMHGFDGGGDRLGVVEAFEEAPTQEHGEGGPAVFEGRELLGLARGVADGNFEDGETGLDDAGGDLRLDLEAAALHR